MFTRKPILCSTVQLLISILFFATVLASAPPALAQAIFSAPQHISAGSSGGYPQMSMDSSGNIYTVWADTHILFARSNDGGITFSSPVDVSQNTGNFQFSTRPALALDWSGNIYVAWAIATPFCCDGVVFMSHSNDGGATFSAPLRISGTPTNGNPQLVVDSGGNINVAWTVTTSNNFAKWYVEFARSSDGGNTFSPAKGITAQGDGGPQWFMAVDTGGNINVLWRTFTFSGVTPPDIFLSRSSDGGATFSQTDISNAQGFLNGPNNPQVPIAIDSAGNINVVWAGGTNQNQYLFSRSTDGGQTFSAPLNIATTTASPAFMDIQVSVDSAGAILIFWSDRPQGSQVPELFYSRSTDSGQTFSTAQVLSQGGSLQVALDPTGDFNVFWQGYSSNDILWSASHDGGATFSAPQDIPSSQNESAVSHIAFDSRSNVYLVWPGVSFVRSLRFSSLTLQPASVPGGNSSTGTVTFSAPAFTGGATVWMSSSDWNVASVSDPVTVPEGATTATFAVSTGAVSQPTSVTISGSYAGVTQSATLTLTPPALIAESLNASSVIGGATPAGTVTLDEPAPAGGIVVSLTSSNPAVVSVPASVTIPQWATSADFDVTTSAVSNATSVTITATAATATRTVSLTVRPATLVGLIIGSSSVSSGGSCTAMIQLSGPAPSGGAVVALGSSDPNSASVPDSVTVPAGASLAYFSVSGNDVSQPTSVTITAIYQGASQSASITVSP